MKKVLLCGWAVFLASAFCLQLSTVFKDARIAYGALAADALTFVCGTAYAVASSCSQLRP